MLGNVFTSVLLSLDATFTSPVNIARRQNTFKHPGILVNKAQLDFTKGKVAAGAEPWNSAYENMDSVDWAKTSWAPAPVATVRCEDPGTPEISQEEGCEQETSDALAAYSMALRWAYTGDKEYATNAITIFDAWSEVLKGHRSNAPEQVGLQSGWVASTWTRAAEIIRYTDAGWSASSITAFETMLKDIYLPQVRNGSTDQPNNIDAAMLEAAQGIAIFLNDRSLYDSVMKRFKEHVPSYIYLTSDGAYPKLPGWTTRYTNEEGILELWQDDNSFFEGRTQETCRDLEHAAYGLASISHMMETAQIQGEDLYSGDLGKRLQTALEVHAPYYKGGSVPKSICGGNLKLTLLPVAEVGYTAFVTRLKRSMPNTKSFIDATRPARSNWLFTAWETLTHAENTATLPAVPSHASGHKSPSVGLMVVIGAVVMIISYIY